MRIGWTTGAKYEWTQHWHFAERVGLPQGHHRCPRLAFVDASRCRQTGRCWPRSTIRWRRQDLRIPCGLSACVMSAARQLEMVIAVIGNWNMFLSFF